MVENALNINGTIHYFNVSTDYLLCQIDDQSEKVLRSFYQLDEDNKDIIIGKIKEILKEQSPPIPPVAAEGLRKASGK